MNLETYEYYTGTTVSAEDESSVLAMIRKTRIMLEAMLGFTLDPTKVNTNLYNEQGISQTECFCPYIDDENLLPPDPVVNAYRTYSYNHLDKFFHVDPFTAVHEVKLIWNNITIKKFDVEEFRTDLKQGWGKFIENCQFKLCICECQSCVQLAVDADWLFTCDPSVDVDTSIGECINEELLLVWTEMVTYELDCKKDVKQESIGSHSYTKFDKKPPYELAENLRILRKFAGPLGTLTKVITP